MIRRVDVKNMSFSNKVVIVTGAGSGIGASTAIHFAKQGADVAMVDKNEETLNQIASEVSKHGREPLILKADLTKDEDVKQIVEKTVQIFGKIDILVNNAGLAVIANLGDEHYIQAYDTTMNTNLRAVALLTSLAVPYLKKTKGNIVNVSSMAGETTLNSSTIYTASKGGLNQFSRNCAAELAEHGVRVNIVSPGPVNTNFIKATGVTDITFEEYAQQCTALKLLTEPEEVAEIIAFLASDKARSVTGSNYGIDAGVLIKSS